MSPSFAARLLMTLTLCQTCTELFGCPTGWLEYKKHCYFYGKDLKTWWDASVDCASKGAHLTSLLDQREKDWLKSRRIDAAWIGLRRETTGEPWQWADGTPFDYSAWNDGEPNNIDGNEHCVEMWPWGLWNDNRCDRSLPYLCKRPVCPTTTPAKPVTCPAPPPCPTTTTAKPVTCPAPPPWATTTPAKPATCPAPPPCPICPATTKPATYPAPAPTTAKPATCPTPPTDGELEMCAMSANDEACSSHDVTCSCLLAMIGNPMGGFQAVLDGLSVARSIVIRGRSDPKAETLVVNLDGRDANGKYMEALHLDMDLESQTFTLHSGLDRKQTGDLPRGRPFGPGLPFKIVIKCGGTGAFHLDFNDELQLDFAGPQLDMGSINRLEVWQVMLSSVRLM